MTRFLICGLGSIGRRHLRNLRALGQEDIVLLRTGKSTLPDEELADLPVESDLGRALERWRPEGVIVANPTSLHLQVALPAARAGCHLLLEKPISHSLEGIAELRAAIAHRGVHMLVGFQFRFHPVLQRVKHLLEAGEIGRPLYAQAHWGEYLPAWHPWEDYRKAYSARGDLGGGVVLTLCHPFDYLCWLLGEVTGLTALTGKLSDLPISVEDSAEVLLEFACGAHGGIHLDYVQRPPAHWLEIIGTRGTLRWDDADGTAHLFRAEAGDRETFSPPAGFERNDLFLAEIRHFIALVEGSDQAPVCTLDDGISALRLALDTLASSRERQWVLSEGRER